MTTYWVQTPVHKFSSLSHDASLLPGLLLLSWFAPFFLAFLPGRLSCLLLRSVVFLGRPPSCFSFWAHFLVAPFFLGLFFSIFQFDPFLFGLFSSGFFDFSDPFLSGLFSSGFLWFH